MKRAALTCEDLVEMSSGEREAMAGFATILRPAESLLTSLVRYQANGMAVTPRDVKRSLKEFRRDFRDGIRVARQLVRQYPEYVLPETRTNRKGELAALLAYGKESCESDCYLEEAVALLETARRAIQQFPGLVLSEQTPETIIGWLK